MKNTNASKLWIVLYFSFIAIALGVVGRWVVHIDPFFHYHTPLTDEYFYTLNNQRSQNDGITKRFDYDALITGTSMTENFKTSEMDELFGTHSIKVPYSGGTYKEINDNVVNAIEHNKKLRYVVRGLDMGKFLDDKDAIRKDLGEYPTYLYDDNILNDVHYIFNRNVIFDRVYPMTAANDEKGFKPGITSFDVYSNWMAAYTFGIKAVCPDGIKSTKAGEPVHLSKAEGAMLLETIEQNLTSAAKNNPKVTFYYFITPYSAVWWRDYVREGTIYRQIEAERMIIEELVKYDNIKLFSFNNRTELTTDINNYKDTSHYGQWINSLILRYMHDGRYQLTRDNYQEYLDKELNFYLSFDYGSLDKQEDYEADYYAAALWNREISGIAPRHISNDELKRAVYHKAKLSADAKGNPIVECTGSLRRKAGSKTKVHRYMRDTEYVGFELMLDVTKYDELVFYGQKITDHGQPTVCVYSESGSKLAECKKTYHDIDEKKHQYLIDVSALSGKVRVIFNGGYTDNTGSANSRYIFSDITLY